jgi:hypothetical protein
MKSCLTSSILSTCLAVTEFDGLFGVAASLANFAGMFTLITKFQRNGIQGTDYFVNVTHARQCHIECKGPENNAPRRCCFWYAKGRAKRTVFAYRLVNESGSTLDNE